jgi:outer membrane receptor protein involved in Fe transport
MRRLTVTPAAHWRCPAGIKNIADRRYREHGSGLDQTGLNVTMPLA